MFSLIAKIGSRLAGSTERIVLICRGVLIRHRLRRQFVDEPIILGGCPRSGTTLLLSILSAHPDIHAIPKETGVFRYSRKARLLLEIKFNLNYFFGAFFRNIKSGSKRWCEKTPGNVLYFKKLLKIFNNRVKMIHIIRDGRDVILSKHPTDKSRYWVEPEVWVDYVTKGLKFRDHPNVLTIKYEDLILSNKQVILEICQFLKLSPSEKILNWYENTHVRENNAWSGEVAPIFNNSIGKWKSDKYQERINYFFQNAAAVELLNELGYNKQTEKIKDGAA